MSGKQCLYVPVLPCYTILKHCRTVGIINSNQLLLKVLPRSKTDTTPTKVHGIQKYDSALQVPGIEVNGIEMELPMVWISAATLLSVWEQRKISNMAIPLVTRSQLEANAIILRQTRLYRLV